MGALAGLNDDNEQRGSPGKAIEAEVDFCDNVISSRSHCTLLTYAEPNL